MQILNDVAGRGTVTSAEFADLQTIAGNLENGIATPNYVASVFYQLVEGSGAANADFTGGHTQESGQIKTLGNLAAGSSATQLNELIGKWFLGTDMPDPTIPGADTQSGKAVYPVYEAYAYPLFGSTGSPQIGDVAQGSIGDCELCSGIIEDLLNHPNLVNSMFVNDGNGVYGVRFYINGTETWVTVNSELPVYDNSLVFNNAYVASPTNGLWVDLIEKAYAQLSATGQIDHPATNSYANIEADPAFDVLTNLTNTSAVVTYESSDANWNAYKTMIVNAVLQHDDVVLETGNNVAGTFDSAGNQKLVSNHAYAVIGYDSATGDFIVQNPWGTEEGTQNYVTSFEVSMSDVASSAVQGDFVVDNSGAPDVVFAGPQQALALVSTVYTSFQEREPSLGANTSVKLAPLFQTQDLAGLAVSQFMVQVLGGTAAINLNGATNLASAAQQAAGEIVVSAADLAKLTLSTGTSGNTIELFLSGTDGTGFSTPWEMFWSVDSQGITVLPVANQMAAPSATLPVSSLFTLAGATGGALTYTLSMDAGLGTFNLNGATNILGGTGALTKIEVSAADLAKVTYSVPSTAGIAVLDIGASSSTQASDLTQVAIDVGYSVATALQDFKTGTVPYQIGIADSAANIFGHLDSLEAMMPNWNLLGVLVDDSARQTETVSVSQFIADLGVLSLVSGNIALDISGATVAQAQSLLGNSANHISAVQIADSAADIVAGLDALETLADAGQIAGITLTDASAPGITLSTAQLSADTAVLNDISGSYSLTVSGSAASVAGDLASLQSVAAKGDLGGVTLTDGGIPNLTVTAAQYTADAAVLADITSNHTLTVQFSTDASQYTITSGTGEVTVSGNGSSTTLSGVAAIQFADITEIVAAAPGSGTVTTGNLTELYSAVLAREPDVGGLAFYQNYLKANPSTPLIQFAEWFLNSSEYSSAHNYAQTSAGDTQFIIDSYKNLLDRTPQQSEIDFYLSKVIEPALANLTAGSAAYSAAEQQAHAQMLVYFSASSEFLSDVQVTAAHPASSSHWLILT